MPQVASRPATSVLVRVSIAFAGSIRKRSLICPRNPRLPQRQLLRRRRVIRRRRRPLRRKVAHSRIYAG